MSASLSIGGPPFVWTLRVRLGRWPPSSQPPGGRRRDGMISSLDGVERLAVSTPNRTYEIVVGGGLLDRAGELCQQAGLRGKAFLVSNTLVGPMYLDRLRASMEAAGYETACALLPDGEGH